MSLVEPMEKINNKVAEEAEHEIFKKRNLENSAVSFSELTVNNTKPILLHCTPKSKGLWEKKWAMEQETRKKL